MNRENEFDVNESRKKYMRSKEDSIIRQMLESSSGSPDYQDPIPIAFDKNFKWLSAKELKDLDQTNF